MRKRSTTVLAVLGLCWLCCGSVGCVGVAGRAVQPNPLVVPTRDFEAVWTATVEAVDHDFDIASENRISRQIITNPRTGATLLEPWRGDSVGFRERLESTLQSVRRFAVATINPDPGGGYRVRIEVFKELEDLARPDRQSAGRRPFQDFFPLDRSQETIEPIP